jgi:hypothetical protein
VWQKKLTLIRTLNIVKEPKLNFFFQKHSVGTQMGLKATTTTFNFGLATIFFCLLHAQHVAKTQKPLKSGVQ